MKLVTKEIEKKFPKLGETAQSKSSEIQVVAKFFTPDSNWTWYATEYDGDDTFFGYVKGFDAELGYFSLSQLKSVKGPMGLSVERDRYFSATLEDVMLGRRQ